MVWLQSDSEEDVPSSPSPQNQSEPELSFLVSHGAHSTPQVRDSSNRQPTTPHLRATVLAR